MSNLTVRQEYAKAAMQAYIRILTHPATQTEESNDRMRNVYVAAAFKWADAMIRHEENEEIEREKSRVETKGWVADVQKIIDDLGVPEFATDLDMTHIESLCAWDQENDMKDGSHRIVINEYFRHSAITGCFKGISECSENDLKACETEGQLISQVKWMRKFCCDNAEAFVKEQRGFR